jgi:uncharacterized membrane protein YeaQ/YmgE (transglycosylase-associated protein family)
MMQRLRRGEAGTLDAAGAGDLPGTSVARTVPDTHREPGMDIVTWLIVGLVAGVLASLVVGGVGLIGDIIVGIVGAFVGGWIFRKLGVHTPFSGLAGTIFVAFIGAVVLLALLRLIRRPYYRA